MNTINERKTTLIIKHIIRTLIIDYPQNSIINSQNSLFLYLNDIILKALSNLNFFTTNRVDILINFFLKKLVRGAIIPNYTQDLLLEIIEIFESLLRVKITINTLTQQLFPNECDSE